jgi:5-methylcytosine-specific restriction endonuclease McrA
MNEIPLVLQLDVMGNPQAWISYEKASYYYCKDLVAWTMNSSDFTLHGGTNAVTNKQSQLTIETIIAVKGKMTNRQSEVMNKVPLTNRTLFRRDQHLCAYCGHEYSPSELSRDHVTPTSKGGPNVWTNVVTACYGCNKLKDDCTPEQAHMPLLYVPYVPVRSEYLILQNRNVLYDQMHFLLMRVSKDSRLLDRKDKLLEQCLVREKRIS